MTDRVKGSILALGGAACWGISGCMGQYLFTTEGMSATWLTPIRLFLAGLILCAYYAIKDHRLLFAPWKNGRDRLDLLIYGIAGVSCCQFLYFLTIDLSTAGIATILQDVSPAMILVVACVLGRRVPRVFEIVSILMAMIGVFLLTTHGSLTDLAVSPAALAAGLLCSVCVVIYTMWPKHLQSKYPTPMPAGLGFPDGRRTVLPVVPPLGGRLCARPHGLCGHRHRGLCGQPAGLLLLHAGRQADRTPEEQSVQLCRTGHRRHHLHRGAGFPPSPCGMRWALPASSSCWYFCPEGGTPTEQTAKKPRHAKAHS